MTAAIARTARAPRSILDRLPASRLVATHLAGGRWRRTLLIAVSILAVPVTFDHVVAPFMHDRRQDALVSQFTSAPRSSTLAFGDAVAVVQIPSIGVNAVVSEGESHATLRAGPAHRSSSPLPGAVGNAVISGKSVRYGQEFARLHELAAGAEIFVQRRGTEPIRFVVDDVAKGGTVDAGGDVPTLSLVTSSSRFGGPLVVVHATAADGSPILDTPLPAAPADDGVSATDLAVVGVWVAAGLALVLLARRAPVALRNAAGAVVFVPVAMLVALQLLLALERLAPATV